MKVSPIGGLTAPIAAHLSDPASERNRLEVTKKIVELQQLPNVGLRSLPATLPNATLVTVPHGLGRVPVWVGVSVVRGPSSSGRVEEIRDGSHDRTKVVALKATGYGATVLVDVAVF